MRLQLSHWFADHPLIPFLFKNISWTVRWPGRSRNKAVDIEHCAVDIVIEHCAVDIEHCALDIEQLT